MEGEQKTSEVKSLLEAIKSSDTLEGRISLVHQLGDLDQSETSDLSLLIEYLPTVWEDSACSAISQCMLNKAILRVASKCLELNVSKCLSHFLVLGTKASMWCRKHLQITIMSLEESSEDEHAVILLQLVVDSLSFSSAAILALTRATDFGEKVLMLIVEDFILEQLNLTKTSISGIKKNQPVASEVVKVVQVVLDATIRLCRKYFQAVKWDTGDVTAEANKGLEDGMSVDYASHVTSIIASTIENLYELGILAAAGGGSLVTVLNISWKGVVSLLQLGQRVLADKVRVGNILLTLISLANESLKCAAERWFLSCKGVLALSEAKRTFLPVKFYLINAVRISSEHLCQAMNVCGEIIKCVLLVSCLGVLFSKEVHTRAASEALADLVEPTSSLLLHGILTSADVELKSKLQILDKLFPDPNDSSSSYPEDIDSFANLITLFDGTPAVDCGLPRDEALMLGRVMLFLNLLKSSVTLQDEVNFAISKKLGYLLNCLMNENIYSSILGLHIPVLCGSVPNMGIAWEPILPFVLHVLKTFMIVASSSSMVWKEVEDFLLQNLFHPHCLCAQVIVELWCFFMRYAETETMNEVFDKFCSLMEVMSLSESALKHLSAPRKAARSICSILSHAARPTVDHVYCSIFNDDTSYASSIVRIAFLMEGFPLNALSDSLKKLSSQSILVTFHRAIANGGMELGHPISTATEPLHALSSALMQNMDSEIIDDTNISQILRFTVHVIREYKNATENSRDYYAMLLGATLDVIASTKQFYTFDEIRDVVLELQTLFVATSTSDTPLYQCKPTLASFMAGLGLMELVESDADNICVAVWDLYRMLLREKHWALMHLALVAFGHFAAQTSCGKLWNFIPDDAALSYDVDTGNETDEERFMHALKAFLEKELALSAANTCMDQLSKLVREAILLRSKHGKILNTIPEVSKQEDMEIADENQEMNRKKRKLPEEMSVGISMLKNGLKVLKDGLANTDSVDIKEGFSTHLSCLEDAINSLLVVHGKSCNLRLMF